MRRRGGILDGVLGLGVLLLVPVALWFAIGVHEPRFRVDSTSVTTDIGMLAWLLWGWCALGLITDVARRLVQSPKVSNSGSLLGPLAAGLVGLIMSVAALLSSSAAPAGALAASSVSPPPVARTFSTAATSRPLSSYPAVTYQVQPGDDLWSIAEHLYGDGDAWILLAGANLGSTMDDGHLFVDPSLILPGWELRAPVPDPQPDPAQYPIQPTSEVAPLATAPLSTKKEASPNLSTGNWVWIAAGLGLSTLGALLLRRQLRPRRRAPEVLDLAVALERLAVSPLLTLTERAILLASEDGVLSEPCVLVVGDTGASISSETGILWRASVDDLTTDDEPPLVAPGIVVPLGANTTGEVSLIIPAGATILVAGPDAELFLNQVWSTQGSLAWGSLLHVLHSDNEGTPISRIDPVGLIVSKSPVANASAAVFALAEQGGDIFVSDTRITLPRFALELPWEPISRLLLADQFDSSNAAPPIDLDVPESLHHQEQTSFPKAIVHLMASQPYLEGTVEPIDPKRARRATEVVAYLALHANEEVTGDRIRTRVLGSSSRDAATKTLFNVASAARRALGTRPDGTPVLPTASRSGCYRAGDGLTTDLDLLDAHLASAARAVNQEERLAHLRAGIELVEGEPLAAVLAGWEWFIPEGHRARMEQSVESAAVSLALEAAACGHAGLVDLAITRARAVFPYSERLAIAAMEASSLLGDVDGVRRAFGELGVLVDELEPGSWPVPELEERFSALTREARERACDHASLAAIEEAPLSTSPSAPAAL